MVQECTYYMMSLPLYHPAAWGRTSALKHGWTHMAHFAVSSQRGNISKRVAPTPKMFTSSHFVHWALPVAHYNPQVGILHVRTPMGTCHH